MSDIVVTKEDEGETLNLYASSSEDDVGEQPPLKVKTQRPDRHSPPARGQSFHRPVPKPMKPQSMIPPNMLDSFTNPEKKLPPVAPPSEVPSLETSPYMESDPYEHPPIDDEDDYQESEGFESLTDEKQDLIYKLYRLQSKGIPVSKNSTWNPTFTKCVESTIGLLGTWR
jgi:hypothetical protein